MLVGPCTTKGVCAARHTSHAVLAKNPQVSALLLWDVVLLLLERTRWVSHGGVEPSSYSGSKTQHSPDDEDDSTIT